MGFRDEILEAARRGDLFLDCHEMELKQNCDEFPGLVRGPGYIKQNEEGRLEFKIYVQEHENTDRLEGQFGAFGPKPGELFQHQHHYTLTAVDSWANRWTAGRIIPNLSRAYHSDPTYPVVTGTIFEMEASHEEDWSPRDHYLDLAIYEKVEVPFNIVTSYYEAVSGGSPERRRGSADRSVFHAAGCDFVVKAEQDVLLISVESPEPIPAGFETRIIEGLLFVLGKPLAWNESKRRQGRIEHVRLRSRLPKGNPVRMKAPIAVYQDALFQKVWVLFDLYLRFIGKTEGAEFHPCSAYLDSVSQASANSADAFALGLAVAVEGLIRTLYKHLGEKGDRFKEAVGALEAYVLAWPHLEYWSKEAGLNRERLPGLIGNLKHVSPQDRMQLLVADGNIFQNHVDVWKKLRTRKAHALDDPSSPEMQELLRAIDSLIVLVYHLVFHAIGYEGVYFDYSTLGYPPRLYPPRLPQPADPYTELAARRQRFEHFIPSLEPPTAG
jgi:hypothetical protein